MTSPRKYSFEKGLLMQWNLKVIFIAARPLIDVNNVTTKYKLHVYTLQPRKGVSCPLGIGLHYNKGI